MYNSLLLRGFWHHAQANTYTMRKDLHDLHLCNMIPLPISHDASLIIPLAGLPGQKQVKSFNAFHLCDGIREEATGKHAPLCRWCGFEPVTYAYVVWMYMWCDNGIKQMIFSLDYVSIPAWYDEAHDIKPMLTLSVLCGFGVWFGLFNSRQVKLKVIVIHPYACMKFIPLWGQHLKYNMNYTATQTQQITSKQLPERPM